ncbi:MAG: UMP kinase [Candidatus Njordarchaeota archaeon]
MNIVLKIGGSILFKDLNLNFDLLERLITNIGTLADRNKIVIVTGGGRPARMYIDWCRSLGLSEFECDMLGIYSSRINAYLLSRLFISKLSNFRISRHIPTSPLEVSELIQLFDIVFCGGFIPGQSTIGVAAEVAEAMGSKYLLIATDVDGIYDKDPKRYPDAKRFSIISIDTLLNMFFYSEQKAGTYKLFDIQSLNIIKRSKILTIVFNGSDPATSSEVINCIITNDMERLKKISTIVSPTMD